jgi:hypothetical protein
VEVISTSTALSICNHIFINFLNDIVKVEWEKSIEVIILLLQHLSDFILTKLSTISKDSPSIMFFLLREPREWLDPLREWAFTLLENVRLAPYAATLLFYLTLASGSLQSSLSLIETLVMMRSSFSCHIPHHLFFSLSELKGYLPLSLSLSLSHSLSFLLFVRHFVIMS